MRNAQTAHGRLEELHVFGQRRDHVAAVLRVLGAIAQRRRSGERGRHVLGTRCGRHSGQRRRWRRGVLRRVPRVQRLVLSVDAIAAEAAARTAPPRRKRRCTNTAAGAAAATALLQRQLIDGKYDIVREVLHVEEADKAAILEHGRRENVLVDQRLHGAQRYGKQAQIW